MHTTNPSLMHCQAPDNICGSSNSNHDITLNAYFAEWERRRHGTVKPSTERRCFSNFRNNISPTLGKLRLSSISRRDIAELKQLLLWRGLKESTINMNLATLHTILASAVLDDMIAANPCSSVSTLRCNFTPARETIHRALSDDELTAFFAAGQNFMHLPALKLLLYTGMRAGEACALKWSDVDIDREIIHIRHTVSLSKAGYCLLTPKTKTSRRDIPVTPLIRQLLNEQRKYFFFRYGDAVNASDAFVFPSCRGGFITPTTLNITIIRILKKLSAGGIMIEHFSSHAFRDTFATKAIEAGMKPETLQGILGHDNIMLTMNLYYHLSEEKKRREMQMVQYPEL